jgi:hypothetical protein
MATVNQDPNRQASTVANRAVGMAPGVAVNTLLAGYLLDSTAMSGEAVGATVALTQSGISLVGKVLRNVGNEKGWTKWVG